jgi:hypothetical protein
MASARFARPAILTVRTRTRALDATTLLDLATG